MHLEVVVTSSIHNHAHEWQVASECVAVAREERRKLRGWGYDEILGRTARLIPLAFESQGRWGPERNQRIGTIGKTEGRLAGGFHPRGSRRHSGQSCAMAPLAQCRASTVECGYGACRVGQATA